MIWRLDSTRTKRRLLLLVFFLLTFWSSAVAVRNVHDIIEVKIMSNNMKTVCVGRFLIDAPNDARVTYRHIHLSYWDISVISDESDEQFATRLAAKELELKAKKNEKGGPYIESTTTIDTDDIKGKIFVLDRSWVYGFEYGKRVDSTFAATLAHVRTNGISVFFSSKMGDDSVDELSQIIKQIKALKPGEIPPEPGFCFGRAMIRDPLTASQSESAVMFLSLKGHDDFSIALDTAAGLDPDRTLLERDADARAPFLFQIHSLRSGKRDINGMPGEEVVDRYTESNLTVSHACDWETAGVKTDLFKPQLSFELSTGYSQHAGAKPLNSSLSETAILELWDTLLSSIRLRPTTPEHRTGQD